MGHTLAMSLPTNGVPMQRFMTFGMVLFSACLSGVARPGVAKDPPSWPPSLRTIPPRCKRLIRRQARCDGRSMAMPPWIWRWRSKCVQRTGHGGALPCGTEPTRSAWPIRPWPARLLATQAPLSQLEAALQAEQGRPTMPNGFTAFLWAAAYLP